MVQMSKDVLIGDLLVRTGVIDSSGLLRAREAQQKNGMSLGKTLAALGLADEEAVSAAIAQSMHLELLSGENPEVRPEVAALLPGDFCHKRLVAPLSLEGNTVRVAFVDPMDFTATQDVEFRTGKRVIPVVASQSFIQSLLDHVYPGDAPPRLDTLAAGTPPGEAEALDETEIEVVDPAKLAEDAQVPPVIRLVNLILSNAAQQGASDDIWSPKRITCRSATGWMGCFMSSSKFLRTSRTPLLPG